MGEVGDEGLAVLGVGWQHLAMPHRLWRRDIGVDLVRVGPLAHQPDPPAEVPEPLGEDADRELVHVSAHVDAVLGEETPDTVGDSAELSDWDILEAVCRLPGRDHGESVRLLELRGKLGRGLVPGDPDRAQDA